MTDPSRPGNHQAGDVPALIGTRAVAALLGRSVRSIRRDHAAGRLPRPVRLGGAVRWRRAEVLGWIAAGCPGRAEWEARAPGPP